MTALSRWPLLAVSALLSLPVALAPACSGSTIVAGSTSSGSTGGGSSTSSLGTGGMPTGGGGHAGGMGVDACQAAIDSKQSMGCEYYAVDMDTQGNGACFAAFIANTSDMPAHLQVEFAGMQLQVGMFARIPSGVGWSLMYDPYDPVAGLPPGKAAILFLGGDPGNMVACPVPPAIQSGGQIVGGSDIGSAFHITSDVPVAAYQINPYGGGSAALTGASLLLPTSVWGYNYLAVTAGSFDADKPSMNIIAAQNDTQVVMLPRAAVDGGGKLAQGLADMPYTFVLDKGEQAQLTQIPDLTGSIIQASKPIGLMAGQRCLRAPFGVSGCEHAEQMLTPINALGSEYVGVMFRPRVVADQAIWRVVGVVDGTQLTYSSDVGGPAGIAAGQTAEFNTAQPFVVKSQDDSHPFMLFAYMTGSQWPQLANTAGYGDADFVVSVPARQYLRRDVFFADPNYPETNVVVVRAPNAANVFEDVILDCAGPLSGWQTVGGYEYTRIDLMRHDFAAVGKCSTGRHEIASKSPFGIWVWGWGTPETALPTAGVSYGYPGGMNVQPINQVVIAPVP